MQKRKVLGVVLLLCVGVLLWAFVLTFYTNKKIDTAASSQVTQPTVKTVTEEKTPATAPEDATKPDTQTYQKPESTRTTHSS